MADAPLYQKILVGVDGSDSSKHALEQALRLAALTSAKVHVLSVEEHRAAFAGTVGEVDEEHRYEEKYFRQVHADVRRRAEAHGVNATHEIVTGHAADALVRHATRGGYDLIVLGHTGHSRLRHFPFGSTADRVTEHATCPVLVVR